MIDDSVNANVGEFVMEDMVSVWSCPVLLCSTDKFAFLVFCMNNSLFLFFCVNNLLFLFAALIQYQIWLDELLSKSLRT